MLRGIDISNNNKLTTASLDVIFPEFLIHKVSEGVKYRDAKVSEHISVYIDWANYRNEQVLLGFYHFMNPVVDVHEEIDNFLDAFYDIYYKFEYPAIPIIDIEGKAHNVSQDYIEIFFYEVEKSLESKPLLYTSASYLPKYKYLQEQNYGLWVASYGVSNPSTGPWPFWALWQYDNGIRTGSGVDMDYFNGTQEQFLKYCYNAPKEKCNCTANCEKCTCWERIQ